MKYNLELIKNKKKIRELNKGREGSLLDFIESFIKADPCFEKFFIKEDGNYFFDLTLFIESRFNLLGVYDIHNLGLCTYENSELFFSNRRAYHKSERDFGRMASIICL